MKNNYSLKLLLLLFSISIITAEACEWELGPTLGYRRDQVLFSSEALNYKPIHLGELGLQGKLWINPLVYVRGEGKVGTLLSGRFQLPGQSGNINRANSRDLDGAIGALPV